MWVPASALGLVQQELNEVDALSYGKDRGEGLRFSVDEWAVGQALPTTPNVHSEGAANHQEAAADIFTYRGVHPGNRSSVDGDGLAPTGHPGLGLLEPNPPVAGVPDEGHNLDAMDLETELEDRQGPVYFSLDGSFLDPLEGTLNTGTAMNYGVSGADVLVVVPGAGAVPSIYAAANQLGLDRFGRGTDDLDALALLDDGDRNFDPTQDRILFSVRRNSRVIGENDSRLGLPIREGDVLTVPAAGGAFPAIHTRAEVLGLAIACVETAGNPDSPDNPDGPDRPDPRDFACDDLDALDRFVLEERPVFVRGDVDSNGSLDISDAVNSLTFQFLGTFTPPCMDAADFNDNGVIGIGDPIAHLAHLFLGGPAPAAPDGFCGVDPTPLDSGTDLGCDSFSACP